MSQLDEANEILAKFSKRVKHGFSNHITAEEIDYYNKYVKHKDEQLEGNSVI